MSSLPAFPIFNYYIYIYICIYIYIYKILVCTVLYINSLQAQIFLNINNLFWIFVYDTDIDTTRTTIPGYVTTMNKQ